jgi:hypothetical protein
VNQFRRPGTLSFLRVLLAAAITCGCPQDVGPTRSTTRTRRARTSFVTYDAGTGQFNDLDLYVYVAAQAWSTRRSVLRYWLSLR